MTATRAVPDIDTENRSVDTPGGSIVKAGNGLCAASAVVSGALLSTENC